MDAEPVGKHERGNSWWLFPLFFTLGYKILSQWLLEPVAMGMITLLAFTVDYLIDRPQIPIIRFVPAICLLAVLFPTLLHGGTHVACGHEAGAFLYGLSIAGLILSTYTLMTWMQGVAWKQWKGWLITGLGFGTATGLLFTSSKCRSAGSS